MVCLDGWKTREKENRLKKMGEKFQFSSVWITKENRKERKVDRKNTWAPPKFFSLQTWGKDGRETTVPCFVHIQAVSKHA